MIILYVVVHNFKSDTWQLQNHKSVIFTSLVLALKDATQPWMFSVVLWATGGEYQQEDVWHVITWGEL